MVRVFRKTKTLFTHINVWLWWHLPIGRQGKELIKTIVFTSMPFIFRRTRPYKNWKYSRLMGTHGFSVQPSDFPAHWPLHRIDTANVKSTCTSVDAIQPLGIVIHAYHTDLLQQLLHVIGVFKKTDCKLFVSTTQDNYQAVASVMQESGFKYHLESYENRGRDILPFLKLSAMAIEQGYRLLLKLHTKKLNHRLSGKIWRKELYDKLLNPVSVKRILEVFEKSPKVGLLGPSGHIVPMGLYYGSNARTIGYLSYRLGLDTQTLRELNFVAGSMFYIRSQALQPLLDLKLSDDLFEEEQGQSDGTMAHAVERIFAASNHVAGFGLADSTSRPEQINAYITKDHRFTW